jgi:hypothetical protein
MCADGGLFGMIETLSKKCPHVHGGRGCSGGDLAGIPFPTPPAGDNVCIPLIKSLQQLDSSDLDNLENLLRWLNSLGWLFQSLNNGNLRDDVGECACYLPCL